jgi:hypothetical protein
MSLDSPVNELSSNALSIPETIVASAGGVAPLCIRTKEAGINLLDFKSDVDWLHVAFQVRDTFLEVIVAGIAG